MSEAKTRLSRREQEMMDIIYARGHATAAEVRESMPDPPTDAAVRTTLRALLEKGHLKVARMVAATITRPPCREPRRVGRNSSTCCRRSSAVPPRAR